MKEKCSNHPDKYSVSFCHSCGKYFCENCLSVGTTYYYCKDKKCQLLLLQLNEEAKRHLLEYDIINIISEQRWKKESNLFYKKTIKILFILWIILTLFLLVVVSPFHYKLLYLLPSLSFIICAKCFIIIYFIRITIYRHSFWEKKYSEELSKEV